MSLTSRLRAMLTYANEKTEAGDTTIGAAIKTLCDGYSGASGSATYPTITDADTLSSRIRALTAYADETTGVSDATLGAAIKTLVDGYGSNPWQRYNQNGLVFQLDCETQCSADTWTDLIGGVAFNSNGAVTLDNGVPTFNGSAYYVGDKQSHDAFTCTAEYVFKCNNGDYAIYREDSIDSDDGVLHSLRYHPQNKDAGWLVSSANSTKADMGGTSDVVKRSLFSTRTGFITCSVSSNYYVNGDEITPANAFAMTFNNTSKTWIGQRGANQLFLIGKIYAIRIYNRLLSADEIQANQAIDLERFQNK